MKMWARAVALAAGLALALLPEVAAAQMNPTLGEAERGIRGGDMDALAHLRIEALRIDAHIVGRTIDMTLELTIASVSASPYEANLALDLPADAVVSGYALSVGDALIPGQLLENPRARNIYEDEVRGGIDPGLAEVSSGNRFTTRIYPIDRAQPRRFRLNVVAPFDPETGIMLPLSRDAAIDSVALDLVVDGYSAAPAVRFAGATLTLARDGGQWRGSMRAAKKVLRDGLAVTGGTPDAAMTVTRHAGGERFFAIADGNGPGPVAQGGRLRIYWDRSLSHGRDRPALEVEALVRLVDSVRPDAIDLVSFASDRPQVATIRDAVGLRAALAKIVYRGGTSLAGLDGVQLPKASRCVLVSDGQVTIDRDAVFSPDCPLALLTASTTADGARLGRIAQGGAGALVRMTEGKAGEAARALAVGGTGVGAVRDAAGRRLPFRSIAAGGERWLVVGPMPESGGVRVQQSDGSERSYASPDAEVAADAAGALWAAQQVQILDDDPARHAEMVTLARRYRVAGPGMSLLVLEQPDQYLRAGIAPPSGFSKEWTAAYGEQKRVADAAAANDRQERFAFVLREWAARKAWWQERFAIRRRPKLPPPEDRNAPPPPPPPVPVAAAPVAPAPVASVPAAEIAADVDEGANIIVTARRREAPPLAMASPVSVVSGEAIVAAEPAAPSNRRANARQGIALKLADPGSDRPYIAALDGATPAARLRALGEQERAYGTTPGFYLEVSDWFLRKGDAATADLLLLSALELPLSDDETRQIVAFRLERDGHHDRAVELAERLAAANAEFRPQPARDLALALAARGRSRGKAGRADLERAFGLLTDAALNPASREFDGFEVIALMEANALIPEIEAAGGSWSLDQQLVALLDTNVRIVIEWTMDDADIDLWVDEPGGERVFYRHSRSSAGGQISNDMTDGYGPEEYAIRRAPAGSYEVRVNGYDADRLNPNGAGHVLVRLARNFARRDASEAMTDVDLSFQQGRDRDVEKEARPVATLTVRP